MCGYAVLKGTHQVDAGLGHNITGHWPRAATPEYRGRRLGNEWGFPGGSEGKKSAWNAGDGFDPWVKKTPWRRERQPIPDFLPGEFHGQRSLAGYIKSVVSQALGTTKRESGSIFSTSRPTP